MPFDNRYKRTGQLKRRSTKFSCESKSAPHEDTAISVWRQQRKSVLQTGGVAFKDRWALMKTFW